MIDDNCTTIIFPKVVALKAEVERLRNQISVLLLKRDGLRLVECRNIEMAYMLVIGSLENEIYELNYTIFKLARKAQLIQEKKSRNEEIVLYNIEKTVDKEFAEYEIRLNEKTNKMNTAMKRCDGRFLSDKEFRELQELYHSIVKLIHPDLYPGIGAVRTDLFNRAVSSYEKGDVKSLRIIKAMVSQPGIHDKNTIRDLTKEKKRLINLLKNVSNEIGKIKNQYPYTMKYIILNDDEVDEKKAKLENIIVLLSRISELYKIMIQEMLR